MKKSQSSRTMTRLLPSGLLGLLSLILGGDLVGLGPQALAQPLAGLVGYWTMEEGSGTNTADLSGNNFTGTFDNVATWGGPSWTNSPLGAHALSCDGVNDRVVIGNPTELRLTGAMTISAWVFPRAFNTSGRIVAKQGASGSRGWSLNVENTSGPGKSGAFMVASSASALISVVTTTSLASNQWVHLCGVYEPGVALRIYTNGFLNNENTVNVPASQYNSSLNITIGGRPTGSVDNPFNGLVDEVRIFNRALTEAEIQALPEVVQTPLAFTLQPASRTVVENRPVTFSAAVKGAPPYFVQWYENDSPIFEANSLDYTIPAVQQYMNGYQYKVVVSNLVYGVTSTNAVLTVSSDSTPPVLVSVGSADGNVIGVCFNEPMDQNTLWDPSRFTVNGGAATVGYNFPRPDGYGAALYLISPISGSFSVAVSGVTDLVGNPIAPGASASGFVAGFNVADFGEPLPAQLGETYSCRSNSFEITAGGMDIWGTADFGHFASQEVSGDFDVRLNVTSVLPVNSSSKAGLMVRQTLDGNSPTMHILANAPAPTGAGNITAGVRAMAGGATAYVGQSAGAVTPDVWIRLRRWGNQFAAFRSTNGMDWVTLGQTTLVLTDPVRLGLVACARTGAEATVAKLQDYGNVKFTGVALAITQPPTNTSVVQNTTATFQAQAEGTGAPASELAYQWQRDNRAGGFTNLLNATGTSYSFTARPADDGAQFRVQVYFAGIISNSPAATLNLTPDVTKPTVISVVSSGDPTRITVVFSEDMDAVSMANAGNYQISGGGTPPGIIEAMMGGNARTVILTTDAALQEGPNYTLKIQNVVDLGVPANVIEPNPSQIHFKYSSLVGHWQFEEGSGTTTADSSGNNFTGTLLNGPLWVPGQVGRYALQFDGSNDRVDVGNPTTLRLTGPMTLAAWVWPNSLSDNGRIVTKGGASGNRGWSLNVENNGAWAFQVASSPTAITSLQVPDVPLNTWVHVAGVYDPNDPGGPVMKCYTNGVLGGILTDNVPYEQNNSGMNVNIGARADGTTRWNGRIDEVLIYARALSEAEIAELATPPAQPPEFLPPTISAGKIQLDWTGSGRLESAPDLSGNWTPVTPGITTPPVSLDLVPGENRFFRLNATP